MLGGALAIVALRGTIAFFLVRNWIALAMAIAAEGLLWAIVKFRGRAFEGWHIPDKYTWKEMLVDVAVFNALVGVLYLAGRATRP